MAVDNKSAVSKL